MQIITIDEPDGMMREYHAKNNSIHSRFGRVGVIAKKKKTKLPHKAVANLLYQKLGGYAATANGLMEEPETAYVF